MTDPKLVRKRKQAPSSSSSWYMLFLVKVLLIVLILLWLAPLVSSKKKRSKRRKRTLKSEIHRTRLDCELECLDLIPEESMNCIFECWSPACYEQLYGQDPLEPGEIDMERAQKMDNCVKLEIKNQRIEERAQKRKDNIAAAAAAAS